jgi:hypothetical protein
LRGREWADLAAAQGRLLGAQMAVWSRQPWRLAAIVRGVSRSAARELAPAGPSLDQWRRVTELERALSRAVRFGVLRPRPKCLARAIALAALIRAAGVPGTRVRIGVQRSESGAFAAHAWVELAGRVVGDRVEYVATFTALADLSLLRTTRMRW